MEWGVVVEILWISNKIKSGTDLYRHSQLPTSNSKLLDKFQFRVTVCLAESFVIGYNAKEVP